MIPWELHGVFWSLEKAPSGVRVRVRMVAVKRKE